MQPTLYILTHQEKRFKDKLYSQMLLYTPTNQIQWISVHNGRKSRFSGLGNIISDKAITIYKILSLYVR